MYLASRFEFVMFGSLISLIKLGRSHAKKFHTNIGFVQCHGESSHHQPGHKGLAGWFDITIEPDACPEYS
jgi:hypothetical protein